MCGIFAAIAPAGAPPCRFAPRAVELLKHRGPDAQGTLHVDLPWASVTLGMSRLKIVDQTDIPVPFDFRLNHGIVLALNGEIYNWRDLRAELPNTVWSTNCDAEVLAAAWRAHGPACLDKLNGMFAFVLVDTLKNEIHAVRDRAGEKPLYYTRRGAVKYWASEPKAFPTALCEADCEDSATLEFDFDVTTPLAGIYAVQPGERWCATSEPCAFSVQTWWELPGDPPPEPLSVNAALKLGRETKVLFIDAVKLRHVAERKVAIQLSGGLDSAMTQAVAKCLHPYCVTFGDELDNLSMADHARASVGSHAVVPRVEPVTFTRDELLSNLSEVAYYLDTPATWTAVCQWFLNKKIAEDGGVVVLSGEGADELFGGYARYRVLHWLDTMITDPHLWGYGPLIQHAFGAVQPSDVPAHMLNRGGLRTLSHADAIVRRYGRGHTLVDVMSRVDFYTTMQALVRMADRMAACFGMENRSPFFDYRLMELAARIPSRTKITEFESKTILRQAARGLGVSWRITDERTKRGLTVPASWGDGRWSRDWFAKEMQLAWRSRCLRPALCSSCESCKSWGG